MDPTIYFPRLVLPSRGRLVADGSPRDVLQRDRLEAVFGGRVLVQRHPTHDVPHVGVVPDAG